MRASPTLAVAFASCLFAAAGPAYQAALKVFNHAGERDFRIIEGLE